ncbi:murein hydrolase activator EnvC family protein [Nocardioides iriomotensis]|uniref:M23 family metallopeptidase n=1 Tax=Nocardioides iriomotensis TaxID=715784 RepID=A0A4Q5J4D4_9ACTN|nr:M23 family metallopeptidase [Nocardioides iriomotensis]RYU12351.1 M23 family metallopeptidase [Nocardioides iriomotensis]
MHPRTRALAVLVPALILLLAPGVPAAADDLAPVPTGAAVWPLSPVPEVGERFDPPDTRWGAGHRGVDLRGTVGQPVRAALPGRITFAGSLAGRGVVVVDHGATRTTYEPVDPSVSVGDAVRAGDRIGTLQLGGSHCFPAACLHWGLRAGEAYLDPLTLVGAGPVRLLPLGADAHGAATLRHGTSLPAWAVATGASPAPSAAPPSGAGPAGTAALWRGGPAP